jgi:rod shape determining protein RodA
MKVLLILGLAKLLHDDPEPEGRGLKHLALPTVIAAVPIALILKQPDLGTALILFLVFLTVMMLTKLKLRSVALMLASALAAAPLTWAYLLRDYQKQRILTFLDPSADPSGAGYHARQSIIAVGSGRWTGAGFMKGTQNQLQFLPEHWTDFPFSVWAEEWGFAGSAVLLALYLALVLHALQVASRARDRFGTVLCMGVAALFFWHVVINIGMVTGILPVVGVTLPLFSYGGSSLVTMMVGLGLVMNVSVRRHGY